MKYYLLELISHEDKKCYTRVQDNYKGRHSLHAYIMFAVRNLAMDWSKEDYQYKGVEQWLTRSTTIEQRVMVVIEADTIHKARSQVRLMRQLYKQNMESLGYTYAI